MKFIKIAVVAVKHFVIVLVVFVTSLVLIKNINIFDITANAQKQPLGSHSPPYKAPNIIGIEKWFNSAPINIADVKGKVVLVKFWTYSCINCIRTLPHTNELYEKYHDKGLVVIGIHSPEFRFEKRPKNVAAALKKYQIKYPVALDNDMKTWYNYQNRYWPAFYLINQDGQVVYRHFGEGAYNRMDKNVRFLLGIEG